MQSIQCSSSNLGYLWWSKHTMSGNDGYTETTQIHEKAGMSSFRRSTDFRVCSGFQIVEIVGWHHETVCQKPRNTLCSNAFCWTGVHSELPRHQDHLVKYWWNSRSFQDHSQCLFRAVWTSKIVQMLLPYNECDDMLPIGEAPKYFTTDLVTHWLRT